MAFPTATVSQGLAEVSSSSGDRNVTVPTCAAGDLLIAVVSADGNPNFAGTLTTNMTSFVAKAANGTAVTAQCFYRICDGSETSPWVLNLDASETGTVSFILIPAATWHGTTVPEGVAWVNVDTTNPDPPSLNPAGWGTEDTLWIAVVAYDLGTVTVSAYPANYTDDQTNIRGNNASGTGHGVATRSLNAASDDPGTFTLSATEDTLSTLIAVRPTSGLTVTLGGPVAMTMTPIAPTVQTAGAQTVTLGGPVAMTMTPIAPTVAAAGPPSPVVMHRIHDIQYHAIIFNPDAAGGPGTAKFELTPDMLNVVWQQALNYPGQAAFSLNRWCKRLGQIDYMRDHIKLYREDRRATKVVFAGKPVKPQVGAHDAIIACWDYTAFLQRSRTGFRVLYPEQTLKQIVDAEWTLAKVVDKSLFEFVTTGTTETPLGLDGVTPIKTNTQFGVIDFDRLYLFFALAELGMANTSNTIVFEITREPPHTFNFWKNRSAQKTAFNFVYPGNLIDYDLEDGHDQIVNDLATVILDTTTGAQTEYALTDTASKDLYRRLQSAVSIKTLYGLNSGSTESDQQKAGLARLLTLGVGIPSLYTFFPRQGEFTPFHGHDLGDSFRVTTRKPDRTGDDVDAYKKMTGVAGAWSPEAGELLQVFVR
jgi:hypothetical protein